MFVAEPSSLPRVRRFVLTVLLTCAALTATACGSSSRATPEDTSALPKPTSAATTTSGTKPVVTTSTAMKPPATTTTSTATVATTTVAVAPLAPPASTEPGATAQLVQQSLCPSEQKPGILAVFGHRKTAAAASKLSARAAAAGFMGLVVERRACRNFAVVLPGLATIPEARAFRREARAAGFRITLDCRSHPIEGGLAAVFGHRRTRLAAEELRVRAAARGFAGLRLQQDRCGDWEVDLYGIKTPAQRAEFGQEARKAGFRVVFEVG
jgi:hypothetical protein